MVNLHFWCGFYPKIVKNCHFLKFGVRVQYPQKPWCFPYKNMTHSRLFCFWSLSLAPSNFSRIFSRESEKCPLATSNRWKASPNLEAVPWIFFYGGDGLPMMVRVELVQKEEHMSGNHGFYDGRVGSRISRKPMLEQLRVLETVQTFGGKHSFDHADQEQNLLSASFNIFQLSSKIFQHLSKSVPSSCCCSYPSPFLSNKLKNESSSTLRNSRSPSGFFASSLFAVYGSRFNQNSCPGGWIGGNHKIRSAKNVHKLAIAHVDQTVLNDSKGKKAITLLSFMYVHIYIYIHIIVCIYIYKYTLHINIYTLYIHTVYIYIHYI